MQPKVSVIIITFNHQKFLRQTLDSVLIQQTNFDFEVIVSDDCSTDNTAAIISEYSIKFPTIIKPLLHPKNLGGFGKNNTLAAIATCKGQYIAALDGDDYWIDQNKLQIQADYLDSKPDFSGCFHNAEIKYDEGLNYPSEFVNAEDQQSVIQKKDLVGKDEVWFIATSAFMFRNGILTNYPDWFHKSKSGDIPRYVLLCKFGPIGYINKVMSVYRKNVAGLSFTDSKFNAAYIRNRLDLFEAIDKEYEYEFNEEMRFTIAKYTLFLARCTDLKFSCILRPFYALKSLWLSRKNSDDYVKEILQEDIVPKILQKFYANLKWKLIQISK